MKSLFFVGALLMTLSGLGKGNAQTVNIPEKVVVITKQNVNVRQSPETSAPVVEKVSTGVMYEWVAQKGTWYEVKDVKTGKTVFVSTSVGRLTSGTQVARTDKGLVENNDYTDYIYKKQTATSEKETTASYAFYKKEEDKNAIFSTFSLNEAYMTGRMFTQEYYYKGKQMGWYLLFDEEVDMEGTVQNKLEQPIVVFSNGAKGVLINGELYTKASNSF